MDEVLEPSMVSKTSPVVESPPIGSNWENNWLDWRLEP